MFGFIKKMIVVAMSFFSCNVLNLNSLKCVSMSSQERKIRPKITDINNN